VAAFDTSFHAGFPPAAYRYPVREAWYRDWGIRRFGFHGLSVAWSVTRAAELLGRPVDGLRLVVAHLGSGCSVTAVDGGRSVDTSMGMTRSKGSRYFVTVARKSTSSRMYWTNSRVYSASRDARLMFASCWSPRGPAMTRQR
jgi:hypothetical protein